MRFKQFTSMLAIAGFSALVVGACAADGTPSGEGVNQNSKLAGLEGKLAFLGADAKVNVSVLVGKQRINANFDAVTKRFSLTGLPGGKKSLVVTELGKAAGDIQRRLTVQFPKNKADVNKLSGIIPDVAAKVAKLDLGDINLSSNQAHLVAQNNPFQVLDTDGDGEVDYDDLDIDDDGTPNTEDEDPWGDEYSDWGWDEEYTDDYTCEASGDEAVWEETCTSGGDGEEDWWEPEEGDYWEVCDDEGNCEGGTGTGEDTSTETDTGDTGEEPPEWCFFDDGSFDCESPDCAAWCG